MQYELPVKTGWILTKNMKNFEAVLKSIAEFEQELVKKYALIDEDENIRYDENGQPKIAPANKESFSREHSELLMCENTVEIIKIKYLDIEDCKIKSSLLFDLDFMFED